MPSRRPARWGCTVFAFIAVGAFVLMGLQGTFVFRMSNPSDARDAFIRRRTRPLVPFVRRKGPKKDAPGGTVERSEPERLVCPSVGSAPPDLRSLATPQLYESDGPVRALLYATSGGLVRAAFDCSAPGPLVGYATELSGAERRFRLFRLENGSRLVDGDYEGEVGGGGCTAIEPLVGSRLVKACEASGKKKWREIWPHCLNRLDGQHSVVEVRDESQLFANEDDAEIFKFNASCIRERHLRTYGSHFLPQCPSVGDEQREAGEMLTFGKQGQPTRPVEEISGCPSRTDFLRYIRSHKPVVIRGCSGISAERWNNEHLVEVAGAWAGGASDSLEEYIAGFDNRPLDYRDRLPAPPPLLAEMPWPPYLIDELAAMVQSVVIWLSQGNRHSIIHYDGGEFLISQVEGQKRITLIDPVDSIWMYADHTNRLLGETPVHEARVDLARFPDAANVPLRVATLSANDTLYIPSRTWHFVESLPMDPENPNTGRNTGVRNLAYTLQFMSMLGNRAECEHAFCSLSTYSAASLLAYQRAGGLEGMGTHFYPDASPAENAESAPGPSSLLEAMHRVIDRAQDGERGDEGRRLAAAAIEERGHNDASEPWWQLYFRVSGLSNEDDDEGSTLDHNPGRLSRLKDALDKVLNLNLNNESMGIEEKRAFLLRLQQSSMFQKNNVYAKQRSFLEREMGFEDHTDWEYRWDVANQK